MKSGKRISVAMWALVAIAPLAMASTPWYVDGVNGSDNNACKSPTSACKTIGHAISLASSGDTISVAAATYNENLTINISLKIIGASAVSTTISGGGVNTVVTVSSAVANVVLSNFAVQNGRVSSRGGGVYNLGTLTIKNSAIDGNSASSTCQSRCFADGGGIYNAGTLTISGSTISGNVSSVPFNCSPNCAASGGGIFNAGTLTISNSTISGNSAKGGFGSGNGGGIEGGTPVISNSTVSGNSASGSQVCGGGICGGAILQNSIVANNTGGNCLGTMTSEGYNLSSDGTCNLGGPGDLNNTDPLLGPLQNNGGPTQTMALQSGSPAIEAGNPSGCTDTQGRLLKTDQRGKPRPDKEDSGGCDMGAYERQTD